MNMLICTPGGQIRRPI